MILAQRPRFVVLRLIGVIAIVGLLERIPVT
jgi:hypothetical protein